MATKIDVEMWCCLDSVGDYAVGTTPEEAREAYENNIQSIDQADGFRLISVTVKVPLPEIVELTGEVSEDTEATLTVS